MYNECTLYSTRYFGKMQHTGDGGRTFSCAHEHGGRDCSCKCWNYCNFLITGMSAKRSFLQLPSAPILLWITNLLRSRVWNWPNDMHCQEIAVGVNPARLLCCRFTWSHGLIQGFRPMHAEMAHLNYYSLRGSKYIIFGSASGIEPFQTIFTQ